MKHNHLSYRILDLIIYVHSYTIIASFRNFQSPKRKPECISKHRSFPCLLNLRDLFTLSVYLSLFQSLYSRGQRVVSLLCEQWVLLSRRILSFIHALAAGVTGLLSTPDYYSTVWIFHTFHLSIQQFYIALHIMFLYTYCYKLNCLHEFC